MPERILKSSVNDSLPIVIGGLYQLHTIMSSDWVEVVGVDGNFVTVKGIYPNIVDWRMRKIQFDDQVVAYLSLEFGILTENFLFVLADEYGTGILGE